MHEHDNVDIEAFADTIACLLGPVRLSRGREWRRFVADFHLTRESMDTAPEPTRYLGRPVAVGAGERTFLSASGSAASELAAYHRWFLEQLTRATMANDDRILAWLGVPEPWVAMARPDQVAIVYQSLWFDLMGEDLPPEIHFPDSSFIPGVSVTPAMRCAPDDRVRPWRDTAIAAVEREIADAASVAAQTSPKPDSLQAHLSLFTDGAATEHDDLDTTMHKVQSARWGALPAALASLQDDAKEVYALIAHESGQRSPALWPAGPWIDAAAGYALAHPYRWEATCTFARVALSPDRSKQSRGLNDLDSERMVRWLLDYECENHDGHLFTVGVRDAQAWTARERYGHSPRLAGFWRRSILRTVYGRDGLMRNDRLPGLRWLHHLFVHPYPDGNTRMAILSEYLWASDRRVCPDFATLGHHRPEPGDVDGYARMVKAALDEMRSRWTEGYATAPTAATCASWVEDRAASFWTEDTAVGPLDLAQLVNPPGFLVARGDGLGTEFGEYDADTPLTRDAARDLARFQGRAWSQALSCYLGAGQRLDVALAYLPEVMEEDWPGEADAPQEMEYEAAAARLLWLAQQPVIALDPYDFFSGNSHSGPDRRLYPPLMRAAGIGGTG